MDWNTILVAAITVMVTFVVVLILVKRGIITVDGVQQAATGLDELHEALLADGNESLFDRIVGYAAIAVHAADQLMRKGDITAEERKETATGLVVDYAQADGVELDAADMQVVDSAIEAQCDMKGHQAA